MEESLRAEYIRAGNQAFHEKNFKKAKECFLRANDKDGLLRLGNYYMYEKGLPLLAYSYYQKAGAHSKVEELRWRMLGAIAQWLGSDKLRPESRRLLAAVKSSSFAGRKAQLLQKKELEANQEGMLAVPVNSHLLAKAHDILRKKS